MSELASGLKMVEDMFHGATKGFFAKIDDVTFKMTLNGLKTDDYDAISITIEQLVKEHRSISIPPLYVVSQAHPNVRVRTKAYEALKKLDPDLEFEHLTDGKPVDEATRLLLQRFGNFKK
ncbi:hypothetical protein BH10CYA1_BH10CYA1_35820 [soil metagenome]